MISLRRRRDTSYRVFRVTYSLQAFRQSALTRPQHGMKDRDSGQAAPDQAAGLLLPDMPSHVTAAPRSRQRSPGRNDRPGYSIEPCPVLRAARAIGAIVRDGRTSRTTGGPWWLRSSLAANELGPSLALAPMIARAHVESSRRAGVACATLQKSFSKQCRVARERSANARKTFSRVLSGQKSYAGKIGALLIRSYDSKFPPTTNPPGQSLKIFCSARRLWR
jgi:hypothetical protein